MEIDSNQNNLLFLPYNSKRYGEGGLRTQQLLRFVDKKQPLVSVITVVFNGEKYLEQTIQSVINQSYNNIEYIIIDGGSADSTLDIVRKYENQIDYWVSEPDSGIYDAMNKGIMCASGEIIGILNSDDLYLKNTIELVIEEYKKIAMPCVFYGDMLKFFENNQEQTSLHKGDLSDESFKKIKISINHPTCFVHRKVYHNFGIFKDKYEFGADRELMMRFYEEGVKFIYLNQIMAKFRLGGTTSSQNINNIVKALFQEYELLSEHNISKFQIYTAIFNKFIHRLRKLFLAKIIGARFTNQLIIYHLINKTPHKNTT